MTFVQNTPAAVAGAGEARFGKIVQCAMAISFGLFIIGIVGFSHIDVVHNAAHDTRHANAFPCH